jgi:hypothetical protein
MSNQSRHQIGFKERSGNFKAGGPIRATGDVRMDAGSNQFGLHAGSFKTSHTPAATSSKMPQRPGSSKPIQKGGSLLDDN